MRGIRGVLNPTFIPNHDDPLENDEVVQESDFAYAALHEIVFPERRTRGGKIRVSPVEYQIRKGARNGKDKET